MKRLTLNNRIWISSLAALSILFGFTSYSYCETLSTVHVAEMKSWMIPGTYGNAAQVIVTVVDENNAPVENVSVTGEWSMLFNYEAKDKTDADGKVTFVSDETQESGYLFFTITNVSCDGYVYTPGVTYVLISTDDPVNQYPVAKVSASLTSGEAPLTVDFDVYGSYDPDGGVASYKWNFCDGSTACEPEVTKCFETAGEYTIELIVKDDQGATASDIVTITVSSVEPDPESSIFVADIAISTVKARKNITAVAIITIESDQGVPIANATVTGKWKGLVRKKVSGVTGADGSVTFTSQKIRKSKRGNFVFKVKDVAADGYTYDADLNIETRDFITKP